MYCAYVQRTSLAVGSVSVYVSLILETLWRALKRLPPRNGLHHHPPPYPSSTPFLQLHHFTKSPSLSIFVMLSIARYTVSEHRHGLTLQECTNTTVLGVTISNTGGDGSRWRLHLWCYQHRAARCENRRRIPQRPQHYQRPQSVSNTTYTSFGGKLKLRSISFQTSTQSLNLN